MNGVLSIVEALQERAGIQGQCLAYRCLQGAQQRPSTLTYAQLLARADAMARELVAQGLSGHRVLVPAQANPEFLVAFYACLLAKVVPAMAFTPKKHRRAALSGIVNVARPSALLASGRDLERFVDRARDLGLPGDLKYLDWSAPSRPGALASLPAIAPHELAFLQFSSGSTGDPKGVEVRHHNLVANLARQAKALGHPEGAPLVSWLPLHHDMGLVGQMLWGLYIGAPVTLLSPMHFFERPIRWLEAIERYGAYTAGGPNFAYEACLSSIDDNAAAQLDLSSWKIAFNGAEPVRMSTMRSFSERFSRAGFRMSSFLPSYGLAESCVFVCAKRGATQLRLDKPSLAQGVAKPVASDREGLSIVSCGRPVLGDEITICDPGTGAPLPEYRIGEITVRGPSVCHGYWNNPSATQKTFSSTQVAAQHQLRTGDLGFIAKGDLYITGRIKDLIINRGQNVYPQDLERALDAPRFAPLLGMKAAVGQVQAQGEEAWMICELTRSAMSQELELAELAKDIRVQVGRNTGVELAGVVLTRPASVPRTSSGKVQRQACKDALERGTLRVLHEEVFAQEGPASDHPQSALELLHSFLSKRAGAVDVAGRSAFELGLGSLDCVLLAQALGDRWGREVSLGQLTQAPDLEAWVKSQGQCSSGEPQVRALLEEVQQYPLSPGQAAIWAVHENACDASVYNVHLVLELSGEIDPAAIETAFACLRERHAVLRTRIDDNAGTAHARVIPAIEGRLDWQLLSCEQVDAQTIESLLREPFDLCSQEPMRVRLVPHNDGATLVWVMHHIAVDFWSLVVLVGELRTLLVDKRELPAPPECSYAQWQGHEAHKIQAQGAEDWDYWSRALGGELPTQILPLDRPRNPEQLHLGAFYHLHLEPKLVKALDRVAQRCKTSRYRLYLALFALALGRQGGQRDLVVGTPITGRDDSRWQNTVGYFVNPAAIRIRIDGADTLASFLERVAQSVTEALEHRTLPFAQIVDRLAPERSTSRWPLYQVAFTYQQAHDPSLAELAALALQDGRATLDWGDIRLGHALIQARVENFDLKLVMADCQDEILAAFQYDKSVLEQHSVEALAQTWKQLVQGVADAALEAPLWALTQPLAKVDGASRESGRLCKLVGCNAEPGSGPHLLPGDHISQRWDRLVKGSCGLMVHSEQRSYSAVELDRWSAYLVDQMRGFGVQRGDRVAIEMPMSAELIAAALACVRMGVAYVPIDPRYPRARRDLMAQDARVRGVWYSSDCGSESGAQPILRWPVPTCPGTKCVALEALAEPHRDEIAYLVYTSGSSGRPKGVEVSHGALLSLVDWHHRSYGTSPQTRAAPTASVGFDASVWEIWPHLLAGATLVLPPPGLVLEPGSFLKWLAHSRVDTLFLATALLEATLEHPDWPKDLSVRYWLTGGDRLGAVQAHAAKQGIALHNHYGPTEAAVVATAGLVEPPHDTPALGVPLPGIGEPLPGIRADILDDRLSKSAVGGVGELYLSGPQLAQGYAHNPRATALHFIPHPYGVPGERMYRTGDRVRRDGGEGLCFEGRSDRQIQIRGQRVEPGELASFLSAQPQVQSAKVLAQTSDQGAQVLTAYVLPHRDLGVARADHEGAQLQDWQELYEQTYAQLGAQGGGMRDEQDLVGWQDSAHGNAIPSEEMWRWVQDSVQTIQAFNPSTILEIGAGSGLLAKALAPKVQRYWATDISEQAVQHLCTWADAAGCASLRGFCCPAHRVLDHADLGSALQKIDTVVLNSVAQYFPSSAYLARMVESLVQGLPGLKQIYVGDVRDAELLSMFHQQTAWARAGQRQSLHAVLQAAQRACSLERELCVSPQWWCQGGSRWQAVTRLRSGNYDNELSRYRYDLVLRPQPARAPKDLKLQRVDLSASKDPLADLDQRLTHLQGPICVSGLLDARLQEPVGLWEIIDAKSALERSYLRVQDIKTSEQCPASRAWVNPHTVQRMAQERGLYAFVRPGAPRYKGAMELWCASPSHAQALVAFAAMAPVCGQVRTHEPWKSRVLSELPAKLLAKAKSTLPSHLVPSALFAVEQWPMTVHGKLDRKALPALRSSMSLGYKSEPMDPAQALLTGLYCEVLGLANVGLDQNFFAAGGDSILAIQIASKARAQGWVLSSGQVLDHPSVRALAPQIHQQLGPIEPTLSDKVHRAGLTAMQQGLWIEQDDAPHSYVETLVLGFRGPLDQRRLKQAWIAVLSRHDALRCEFHWDSTGGSQRPVSVRSDDLDWEVLDSSAAQPAAGPLDLSQAPVMRWRLVAESSQCWELHWTHSHLLLDGWSVAIVVAEVLAHYVALGQGRPLTLDLAPSFVAYAEQLASAPKTPPRADYWRDLAPAWQASQGRSCLSAMYGPSVRVNLDLTKAQGQRIRCAAAKAGTTISNVILTAWAEIWKRIRQQKSGVLGIVDAGRDQSIEGIESMVGLLIQSFPLVLPEDGDDPTWDDLYCRRSTALRKAKQEAQGQARVDIGRWLGAQRAGELWDCLVAVENYPRSAGVGPIDDALILESVSHRGSTHYPVTLVVSVHEGVSLQLELDSEQIDPALAPGWLQALAAVLDVMTWDSKVGVQHALAQIEIQALQPRCVSREETSRAPSANADPQSVAALWGQVMGRGVVATDDDFFALGGDSIVAMTLVQRLRAHGWGCSVQTLMNARTPEALAKELSLIEQGQGATAQAEDERGPIPLIPIQRWLLNQELHRPQHFNQALRVPVPGGATPKTLAAALEALAQHHLALRCNLTGERRDTWALKVEPEAKGRWPLETLDLRGCEENTAGAALRRRCEALQSGFDLRQGPLFVALWVQRDPGDEVVLIAHHLVVDAVSWRVLLSDLSALLSEPCTPLAPVGASLGQWSRALAKYAHGSARAQLGHWSRDVLTQPCAWLGKEDAGQIQERRYLVARLGVESTGKILQDATQNHRAQFQELLLASFARSLRDWPFLDQREIVVDIEGHGRYESVLDLCVDRSIGWFTTQFPLALPLAQASWATQIEQVKRAMRKTPDHGLGYGALRMHGVIPASTAKLSWNYLGQVDARFAGASSMLGASLEEDAQLGGCHDPRNRCAYVIDLNLSLVRGELHIHVAYGPTLCASKMQEWLDAWVGKLRELADPAQAEHESRAQLSDFDLVLDELDDGDLNAILRKVQLQ